MHIGLETDNIPCVLGIYTWRQNMDTIMQKGTKSTEIAKKWRPEDRRTHWVLPPEGPILAFNLSERRPEAKDQIGGEKEQ